MKNIKTLKQIVVEKKTPIILKGYSPCVDINSIPYPNRNNLLKYNKYIYEAEQIVPLLTSRGCPYNCSFCSKEIFGYNYRVRSPYNVIGEMDQINKSFSLSTFQFRDDIFTLDRKNTLQICEVLKKRNYKWLCNTRMDCIDMQLAKIMYYSGCKRISFGIESFDTSILKYLNKKTGNYDVINKSKMLKDLGINIKFYIIVGVPGQTIEIIDDTINILKECNPNIVSCSMYLPFPGTKAESKIGDFEFNFDSSDLKEWENAYYHVNFSTDYDFAPIKIKSMTEKQIIQSRNKIINLFN